MGIYRLIILFLLGALTLQVEAQDEFVPIDGEPRIKVVFYKKVQKEFYQGDSITVIIMPELPVYPPLKFKNKREAMRYNKLVYNVKKTLPIAKMVNQTISDSQGKLLIKLVDRECNQSSFEIVKAFFGPFKAGFYQTFASIFGASLKKDYDPEADDRLTERVVRMVEAGTL